MVWLKYINRRNTSPPSYIGGWVCPYAVSKYLAQVLRPLVGRTEYTVGNSAEFVHILSDCSISKEDEMVSFDVKSLYTSLPKQRTLRVVRECLQRKEAWESMTILSAEEIIKLLEVCLTSTYFTFQNNFYRLSDRVEMSSPVSSVVANIFMEDFEQKAVTTARERGPRMWRCYVDDVFFFFLSC